MKILVLYYSMYGHMFRMAQAVAEGAGSVDGVEVKVAQAPELMPDSVIESSEGIKAAKGLQKDIPIATNDDLAEADGVVFGSPTRFGNMCAQMRNFLDQTGSLWASAALVGKPAGFFTSSNTLHGGQETTIVSMMFTALHHGMILVGVPYSVPEISITTTGGSPYGASTVAGPKGDQMPNELELKVARILGQRVAEIAKKLKGE